MKELVRVLSLGSLIWHLLVIQLTGAPLLAHASEKGTVISRPVPKDGGPTDVRCVIAVLDVDEISDASQNFTVSVFIGIRWIDPRLTHKGAGVVRKELSEIWHPNLIFLNKQRSWSSVPEFVDVAPDGEVRYHQQFWGDFSQPMDLHEFPFDSQDFELRMVAVGPEDFGELNLIQDPEFRSFYRDNYSVADWKLNGGGVDSKPLVRANGTKTESFAYVFNAERLSQHYLIKVIAPLLMIVCLSWVVFWLDPNEGGSQLGVAVTAFLTVIAFHVALGAKLPEISYLTKLDIFVFGATLLVFLAMLEVVFTTGFARTGRVGVALRLDKICRFVFPGALALIGFYTFVAH